MFVRLRVYESSFLGKEFPKAANKIQDSDVLRMNLQDGFHLNPCQGSYMFEFPKKKM